MGGLWWRRRRDLVLLLRDLGLGMRALRGRFGGSESESESRQSHKAGPAGRMSSRALNVLVYLGILVGGSFFLVKRRVTLY